MPDERSKPKREVRCPCCDLFFCKDGIEKGKVMVICPRCRSRVTVGEGLVSFVPRKKVARTRDSHLPLKGSTRAR